MRENVIKYQNARRHVLTSKTCPTSVWLLAACIVHNQALITVGRICQLVSTKFTIYIIHFNHFFFFWFSECAVDRDYIVLLILCYFILNLGDVWVKCLFYYYFLKIMFIFKILKFRKYEYRRKYFKVLSYFYFLKKD